MHEAKTHLSRLVERAAAGEEVIIGRAGRPVARLVPYVATARRRTPGRWQGRVTVSADFDVTPEDLLGAFEGG
ncbi:MAG: type II toxin-antitoxin system Phd/YefM family antitoxin [Acidimicrobiia bacterium]